MRGGSLMTPQYVHRQQLIVPVTTYSYITSSQLSLAQAELFTGFSEWENIINFNYHCT